MSNRKLIVFVVVALLGATFAVAAVRAQDDETVSWVATLSAAEEVPTPGPTRARGVAIFQLSEDGMSIHYKLIVANINDLLMAHIHVAPVGVAGPVVVWLYPDAPPPALIEGRFNGVLAEGTITSASLVGPLAGMSLSDLIDAMNNGGAYVNVHTVLNPAGEIRGQIRQAD